MNSYRYYAMSWWTAPARSYAVIALVGSVLPFACSEFTIVKYLSGKIYGELLEA